LAQKKFNARPATQNHKIETIAYWKTPARPPHWFHPPTDPPGIGCIGLHGFYLLLLGCFIIWFA
jgi:hypothetical protein